MKTGLAHQRFDLGGIESHAAGAKLGSRESSRSGEECGAQQSGKSGQGPPISQGLE
jgi:hypothetical protein